jgi:hypothetical protein
MVLLLHSLCCYWKQLSHSKAFCCGRTVLHEISQEKLERNFTSKPLEHLLLLYSNTYNWPRLLSNQGKDAELVMHGCRIIIHHRRVEELHGYQINDLYRVGLLFAIPSYVFTSFKLNLNFLNSLYKYSKWPSSGQSDFPVNSFIVWIWSRIVRSFRIWSFTIRCIAVKSQCNIKIGRRLNKIYC